MLDTAYNGGGGVKEYEIRVPRGLKRLGYLRNKNGVLSISQYTY